MKPDKLPNKKRRRRHLAFNPNHEFIADAVEEYLREGGKIKQLEPQEIKDRQAPVANFEDNLEADEFLSE